MDVGITYATWRNERIQNNDEQESGECLHFFSQVELKYFYKNFVYNYTNYNNCYGNFKLINKI